MAEKKVRLEVDSLEQKLIIGSLNDLRNHCIRRDIDTEVLDNLLLKVIDAKSRRCSDEREDR